MPSYGYAEEEPLGLVFQGNVQSLTVLAIDIESHNLLATASHDRIEALTVHGVCEVIGDLRKDQSQERASHLAAAFAFELIAKSF